MLAKPQLSLSLAGLAQDPDSPWAGGPRAAISWAARTGYRHVQLDAAAVGVRPRELDRSARRDLAALLRRLQLGFTGLDLWIPPEHLTDPARADRAMEAIGQALEMAAELSRLLSDEAAASVSVLLPAKLGDSGRRVLAGAAAMHGARLADHALMTSVPAPDDPIGIGLDPASLLLAGQDPAQLAARAGPALVTARLTDATMIGRTVPLLPSGRLDALAYTASLAVAGYARPLVLDLRALPDQAAAASGVLARWA